jgi:hypothetical protein
MNLDTLYEFEISSRRRIDPSKYQDVKPWVPKAIAGEDQKPKTQLWEGEPTEDGQKVARLWRIKFLRKYEKDNPLIKAIADRLAACRKENRCCSGACPECGWLLQRWFVRKSKVFISDVIDKDDQQLVAITIIPSQPIIAPGQLNKFYLDDLQRRLKFALDKAGLGAAIGGIDFSFNEDREEKYPPFWCIHSYIVTSVANKESVKRLLKEVYKRDARIPRPVKISKFENSRWRRSYVFKITFPRRVGYDALKIQNGLDRKCRNTSRDKLRAKERLELFSYLDQCALTNRFIFRGAKPTISSSRVTILKTKLTPSYQRKSKKRQ